MTAPTDILGLPKPAWAADDVAMLYDMATRFMAEEIAPRYDEFEKNEMVDRASWEKAGAAGLLCASMPEEYGGSGGTFAHESAIIEAMAAGLVDEVVLLSEAEIAAAMRRLFLEEGWVAEGGGAVGVALLQDRHRALLGLRVAMVVSGRGIDMGLFRRVVDGEVPFEKGDADV